MNPTLADLLGGAATGGDLPAASVAMFTTPDMGAQIQAGLGISVDDVDSSEVIILARVVDDTGSIGSLDTVVMQGCNECLDAIVASKSAADVLVQTNYLYKGVQQGYTPIKDALRLDRSNYAADAGSTPLRRSLITTLAGVAAKVQEFRNAGVSARSVTFVLTDGDDNASHYGNPSVSEAQVKAVVESMLKSEQHLVLFMGVGSYDFRKIARNMGIPDNCVLTPSANAHEVRGAFRVVSQSFARASQAGGAGFSQTAAGGFGA